MTIVNPALNKVNKEFEYILTADNYYSYGEPFGIEVLLDGLWYCVPLAHDTFISIGYSIDESTELKDRTYTLTPVFAAGILPAGQYRLVKSFDLVGPDVTEWGGPVYLKKEIVIAEFTVEETIEWLG
jgi:hypothetical protein